MIIGKVIDTVISTRKNALLTGSKFLIVKPINKIEFSGAYQNVSSHIVAVDNLGAGIGEIVIVSIGSAARIGEMLNVPVDALIVGIVDNPGKLHFEDDLV